MSLDSVFWNFPQDNCSHLNRVTHRLTDANCQALDDFRSEQAVTGRLRLFRQSCLGPLVRKLYLKGHQRSCRILFPKGSARQYWKPHFEALYKTRYRNPGIDTAGDVLLCVLLEHVLTEQHGPLQKPDLQVVFPKSVVDFRIKRFLQHFRGDEVVTGYQGGVAPLLLLNLVREATAHGVRCVHY